MTRYIAALGLAILGMLFAGLPGLAQQPPLMKLCVPTSASVCPPVTATAPLPVTGSFSPSGTQNTNLIQWNSVALGSPSAYGTSPGAVNVPGVNAFVTNFPATQPVSGTFFQATQPVSNAGTFAVQGAATQSGTWTVQPGNTPNTVPWLITSTPSAAAGAGVAPVSSSALAANTVIKASAGNLYSFEVSADSTLSGAAWWIMIYNATSAPGDGAVTPLKCYAMASGTTAFTAAFPTPVAFSTGIVIGVSTSGCFTKTASTHAFISGDAQ